MSLIEPSTYHPPFWLRNGHLQTIYPSLFRRVKGVRYQRERIATPDGDFLDLDWSKVGSRKLVILSHGLEGNTYRAYMLGMVRAVNRAGWDALARNFRGCSGEPNRLLRFYHSGDTEDLETVIQHVLKNGGYEQIALVGFSMGGNVTLKYLGERDSALHPSIAAAVAISVPCDLAASAAALAGPANKIYMKRFLHMLHQKVLEKARQFPGQISDIDFKEIKSFREFDNRYTAPLHGFKDAADYWQKSSCINYLGSISIPGLLINAKNDPFLSRECYPLQTARENPNFYLEMPQSGGHVGFVSFNADGSYWSELRGVAFLRQFFISPVKDAGGLSK